MEKISESIAHTVKTTLQSLLGEEIVAINTEIQDGGGFILITIEVDSKNGHEDSTSILQKAMDVLPRYIEPRADDYSWMINIECRGELLDSECGGLHRG